MSEAGPTGTAGPPGDPRRAAVVAVAGVLAAVGLMLLLVTWAAAIGPQQVLTKEGNPPSYAPPRPSSTSASPAPTGGSARSSGDGQHDVLFTVMTIAATLLATVVMLAFVLTALRWLATRDWRRQRPEADPDEIGFDPLDAPEVVARSMVADAVGQREVLAEGSPRNAIVACWHRFEQQAETAGVRRRPWETSSEFTLRVLDRLSADDEAVLRLGELYRDARHSSHEITEADRDRAAEALDRIHRSLEQGSLAPFAPPPGPAEDAR